MKGQTTKGSFATNNSCFRESVAGKEKAYCHLFNASCAICPFNQRDKVNVEKEQGAPAVPEKYLLSREHLWVAPASKGRSPAGESPLRADERLLVGLDSFLARSFFHVRGIVQPALLSHLCTGKSCVWIIDILGTISLRAPISGTVTACNHELVTHPSSVKENPYGGGWLFEVEPEGNWKSELMDAAKGHAFIFRSQNMLKDKMVNAATGGADSSPSTDQRAADGGMLCLEKIMETNPKAYLQTLLATLEESRQLSE